MNSVIAATEKTGNSNAIKFTFDIYEPYSMGLLLQSMQNAAVQAGYISYLDNTPYVLRMDIQGYDETGIVIKSIKSKFFTLKLTNMSFSVNEGGSVYKVEGVPYNHQGFSDVINTAYNDLKIFGDKKGTVGEILSTGKNSLVAVLNRNEEKLKNEGKIGIPDQYSIQFPKNSSEWYSSASDPPKNNTATVKPETAGTAEKIRISGGATADTETADLPQNEIGGASLGFDQLSGGNVLFKRANDQYDAATGQVKRDGMTIDPKLRAFQFSQGQSLTSMINQVILSSDFAKKTIQKLTPEGYIKWFKLDVQVELLQPDPITGDYAKKITYRVVPYLVHHTIFANPNAAPVGYPNLMKNIAKEYNYIYTGQNVDILRFDIQIKNLFYTGIQPSPESEGAKTNNQDQKGTGEKTINSAQTGQGQAPAAQAAQQGRARPKRDPKLLAAVKGGSGDKTTEQVIAEGFQNAFVENVGTGMVSIELEILGDPYWLVDSGIANYFSPIASDTAAITADGTMNYESGNIYIYITFKTPADINETTGLYDFSNAGKESPFGGIYRVTQCENIFNDGMWKQKLKCVRMPGPQGPEVDKGAQAKEQLTVSKQNNNVTEIDKAEPPKTSPIQDTNKTTPTAASQTVTGGGTTTTTTNSGPATATRNNSTASNSRFTRRTPSGILQYYKDTGE